MFCYQRYHRIISHNDRVILCSFYSLHRRYMSHSVPSSSENDAPIRVKSFTTRHRNKQWEQMFKELLDYRTRHGDMLVPADYPENPQLATWVDTQRQQFRILFQEKQHRIHIQQQQMMMKQNVDNTETHEKNNTLAIKSLPWKNATIPIKKSNLTQERIQLLESEGFIWDAHALKWEERYQDLVQYKNTHGTVIVPKVSQYETLYNWVFTQRRQYKFKIAGIDHSSLTQERIDKLDALGFIWNYQDEVWMGKFQELQKFKRDHGHCLIPSTYFNRSLAKWIEVQRMHYRNIQKQSRVMMADETSVKAATSKDFSSKSPLTETRIQLLEKEGFIWDVAEYQWNIHFEQLEEFVNINGHAFVPTSSSLGRWCQKQRMEYFKMIRGEKTSMTETRRDKLIQLSFIFEEGRSLRRKASALKRRRNAELMAMIERKERMVWNAWFRSRNKA